MAWYFRVFPWQCPRGQAEAMALVLLVERLVTACTASCCGAAPQMMAESSKVWTCGMQYKGKRQARMIKFSRMSLPIDI